MRFLIGIILVVGLIGVVSWAATTRTQIYPTEPALYEFDATTVDSNGYTSVSDEIVVFNVGRIVGVEVCNTGATYATDAFKIERKMHPNSTAAVWLSGTDFDTATTTLRGVSTTGPHETAVESCSWFDLDVSGAWSIQFYASAATHDTTVRVRCSVGAGAR